MINTLMISKKVMMAFTFDSLSHIRIKILVANLIALSLFSAAYTQTLDKPKLDQFFDLLYTKNKAMGSLNITLDGSVLYSKAIGYSQINAVKKEPFTQATRCRIGSISKMFTATMVFQLIEKKKLTLSDHLDKFFPQVPNAEIITIAQLLGHRSGIHDIIEDRDFTSWKMNPKTKDEILAIIAKSMPAFEPGTKYAYSNTNYILLGYIVEKITGESYAKALKKNITSKIGLKDTYLGSGKSDATKNESFSYRYLGDWKEQENETDLSIPGGAGGIISTPGDLAKFIQALFKLELISQESLNQMKPMKEDYGMGMERFTFAGKTFYGHTGGIDGFGSWLAYQPEEKLVVAYTTNGKVYPVGNIISGVIDIYYNRPFAIPTFNTIAISHEVLDKYVGVYSSQQVPIKFTISREGGTLIVQGAGQSSFPLEATAQDKFIFDQGGIVMEFDATKKQMILKRRGREIVFQKEG